MSSREGVERDTQYSDDEYDYHGPYVFNIKATTKGKKADRYGTQAAEPVFVAFEKFFYESYMENGVLKVQLDNLSKEEIDMFKDLISKGSDRMLYVDGVEGGN